MSEGQGCRACFAASLAVHLALLYAFSSLYPRGTVLDLLLTSLLLGSSMGISAVYGASKGFGTSALSYALLVAQDIALRDASLLASAAAHLRMFIVLSTVSIIVGALAATSSVGSVLAWSFVAQVAAEVAVSVVEMTADPVYVVFTLIPYSSPRYLVNSLASLLMTAVYALILRALARGAARAA